MEWIWDIIKSAMKEKFTGSIRINLANGGVANVNKVPAAETFMPPS